MTLSNHIECDKIPDIVSFRSFIEKMNEGIIQVDKHLNIVYCNPLVCELLNASLTELVGKSMLDYLGPKNRDVLLKEFSKRKSGFVGSYEMDIKTIDNRSISTMVIPHPIYDSNGEFDGSFSVITDITRLKDTEQKLLQSEERYRLLTENIPSVVWSMNQDGQFTFISTNSSRIFGYSPEEIIKGGSGFWTDQIHPDDAEYAVDQFEYLYKLGQSFNVEFRFLRRDGNCIWIKSSANVINKPDGSLEVFGTFNDISQQKEAELARLDSEEKLRVVFNNRNQLTGLLSPDGVVLDINDAALDFIGVDKDKVINLPFWETPWWTHDKQLQRDLQHAIKYASNGQNVHFEVYHINKAGEKRYIDFTLRPVMDNGKVKYLVPEGHDFTEQRNITQSLYNSITKYQLLFETASDGIFILNDEKIIDCNKKALEMFECNRDQIIGAKPADFSPTLQPNGRLSDEYSAELGMLALAGNNPKFEWSHTTFKGRDIIVEVSLNSIMLKNTKYLQAFNRDITEKKIIEQSLIESEEKYRNLVELANDGVIIVQLGYLKFVNSKFLNVLGYTLDEILDHPLHNFVHPDDLEKVRNNFKKRVNNEYAPEFYNFRIYDKFKNEHVIEANATRIMYQGEPASFAYIRDITERLKNQEKMAFIEKMSTIGQLSRKVAHEIGNPLSSILHSASELHGSLALTGDEKILMDIVLKETKRLDDIIKNFLSFSRPRIPSFQNIDLVELVNEVIMVFKNGPAMKMGNIVINVDACPNLPAMNADPDMLKEVLWNILINARDAMEQKGIINIKMDLVTHENEHCVQLKISDNGPGIEPDVQEKIFEPYYTSKFSGSGLGLATVKKNIAEHDGTIAVKSVVGSGSEFIIYLPVERRTK